MKTIRASAFPNGEVRFTVFSPVSRETHSESDLEGAASGRNPESPPLTLGQNSNSHDETEMRQVRLKPGHGAVGTCKTFTGNGRRRLLRAGGAIDRVIDKPEQCVFLTGTLPGGTEAAKRAIAEWSSYAINLVQSWLSRKVPDKLLMYSWEFQKRGALHLHLTMVCKDSETRKEILTEWKKQWERVIDGISKKSGVNCWERIDGYDYSNGSKHVLQTDAQECNKSAAAYLSKYLSKSHVQGESGYQRDYHPARYWGISRPLCKLLDELTETIEVYISSDSEAQAVYEDCLSVATSLGDCAYNWGARVGTAVAAVAYKKQDYLEELWKPIKSTIQASAKFSWQDSTLAENFLKFAARLALNTLSQVSSLWDDACKWSKEWPQRTASDLITRDLTSTEPTTRTRGISACIDWLQRLASSTRVPSWVHRSANELDRILENFLNHDITKTQESGKESIERSASTGELAAGTRPRIEYSDGTVVCPTAAVLSNQLSLFPHPA